MRYLASIVLLMMSVNAGLAQQEKGYGMGIGMDSCAEFAKNYRNNPTFWETAYFTWVQGFMSGLNILQHVTNKTPRDLNGLSLSDQKYRLRMFCDQRPLVTVAQAAVDIFQALPEAPLKSN